ncbi:CatB-related O-acetyltransferase [Pseudocitrobacter vendiensis]|nr:CatB-related O-acetyltransferase [Pseudocitrobacter vendiensis]
MNELNKNLKKNILGYGLIERYSKIECWRLRGFFFIGAYTHLNSGSNIWNAIVGRYSRIDSNVTVGFRIAECSIFSNHYFAYAEDYIDTESYKALKATRFYYDKQNLTYIGNDVRVHQGSIISAGVSIGDGAIIYPNSVVDTDVPPYAIVAGNPAQIIKYRFSEDVIEKIKKSNWFLFDLNCFEQSADYSDVDSILSRLADKKENKVRLEKYYVNSYTNECNIKSFERLVLGPSHVDIWQSLVNSGKRKQPEFLMHGVNGLSLYSKRLVNLIDFYIGNGLGDVVLFVPDFRIGNVIFNSGGEISLDPLFISKNKIGSDSDNELYKMALNILDELVLKYGSKIKFIFWCLMGRECENKKIGRYVFDNQYQHPVWNYSEIKNRYFNNILEMPGIESDIEHCIHDNGTIHPNDRGYDLLEKHIVNRIL